MQFIMFTKHLEGLEVEYIFIVGPYLGETQIPAFVKEHYPDITAHYVVQGGMKGQSHALYLARQFDARTRLGRYLDPLADKALLVSVYVVLGMQNLLPAWLVVIVVFRDLLIVGGALLFFSLQSGFEARPIFISKLNTVTQIALAGWLLAVLGIGIADHGVTSVLIWIVAATTVPLRIFGSMR